MTVIVRCKTNCQHDFQDKQYGPGMRVHNITNKGRRCTVCGHHEITGDKIVASEKAKD